MKNYIKQVAEMLDVELGEYFYINDKRGVRIQCGVEKPCRYCLTTEGLYGQTGYSGSYYAGRLMDLLCGKATIEKIPWKPHLNERYYYIACNDHILAAYNTHSTHDAANILFGNYFRTEKEAETHREEISNKIKAVFDGE